MTPRERAAEVLRKLLPITSREADAILTAVGYDALLAERDRYKGALERVALEPAPGSTTACRRVASAALRSAGDGGTA